MLDPLTAGLIYAALLFLGVVFTTIFVFSAIVFIWHRFGDHIENFINDIRRIF